TRVLRGRASHANYKGDPTVDDFGDDIHQSEALLVQQRGEFSGVYWSDDSVRTSRQTEVDDVPEARFVECSLFVERRRWYCVYTLHHDTELPTLALIFSSADSDPGPTGPDRG